MPVRVISMKIKDTIFGLIRETGDLIGGTIEVTRAVTARTLRATRRKRSEAPRIAGEAVEDAIRAASEAGGTELGSVAKGAVIGVIEGVGEASRVTLGVVGQAVRAAVKGTSEVGGDVVTVARKAVEGAIEAGKQTGLKAEDAATTAARSAIEAAGEISEGIAAVVARAVTGTVSGVRVALEAPLKKSVILAVDSNRTNLELLTQHLGREGYKTLQAGSLDELDKVIQGKDKIALTVVDLAGFDSSIWQRCDRLTEAGIPFLVISPQRSPAVQKESIKHGARGVLVKPVSVKELAEYIRTLIGE